MHFYHSTDDIAYKAYALADPNMGDLVQREHPEN